MNDVVRALQLKRKGRTNGGEFAGPCPKCGGEDRFRVWPDHPKSDTGRFWCRQCDFSGDGITYRREVDGLSFKEACKATGQAHKLTRPDAPQPDRLKRLASRRYNEQVSQSDASSQKDNRRGKGGQEQRLRAALLRFRAALKSGDSKHAKAARAYVESRGLSVDLLHAYGCGYAAPGEWLQDGPAHSVPGGRIVTPHTTPAGRLINLYGRAVGDCQKSKKHRHLAGDKALFNGQTIREGEGPLVVCEASLDALAIIGAGHARSVAIYGKDGLPWAELRGHVRHIVFALDTDAQDKARELAREATLKGYSAYLLPAAAYGGAGDACEAAAMGTLDLSEITALTRKLTTPPDTPPEEIGPPGPPEEAEAVESREDTPPPDLPAPGQTVKAPFPAGAGSVGEVQDAFYSEDWGCYRVAVKPEADPFEVYVFCLAEIGG